MTAVEEVWDDFTDAVNMTAKELDDWLATDESQEVGWSGGGPKDSPGGEESVGHESGRRIVDILHSKKADLSDDDAAHMRKVVGYVKRHLAQRPDKPEDELEHARWTASLKNWGHDPLKR